jgi:hypothetical protein
MPTLDDGVVTVWDLLRRRLRPAARDRWIERWLLLVTLFYRNNRLYQVVGNAVVAGGQAEVDAMRFQQSLDLT